MNKYLIGYVTKTGTTKAVAERIQAGLQRQAISTELHALDQVGDLSEYAGVIIGSPVNGMRPLPAFTEFLTSNRPALNQKIVGVFILSYIYQVGRPIWKKRIDGEVARIRLDFNPGKVAVFGARMASGLPGIFKLLFGIPKNAPSDNRDWVAIDAWTDSLAAAIKA